MSFPVVSYGVPSSDEFRALRRDLRAVPPALRAEVRSAIKQVGDDALSAARTNAAWSSRIPGSLALRVNFSGKRIGVEIVASRAKAPHARVYEGITGAATFRHPVFADRERWVAQTTRPYLIPAARQSYESATRGAQAAIDTVLARHGFGRPT